MIQIPDNMAEDEGWEDVPEEQSVSDDQDSQVADDIMRRSRGLRRRKLQKATYVARGPVAPAMPKRKAGTRREISIPTDHIIKGAVDGATFTGRYALDVVKTAINLMRKPLGILLFTLLLSICMTYIGIYLRKMLTPVCFLPIINQSRMCTILFPPAVKVNPWEELMQVQTKTFDELLEESVGGSSLSLEVKKAEMATADLITLVRHSELKSRDMLAMGLREFVEDAKRTGRGLQKMSAKVAGAVDNILAINTYALRMIEEANAKKGTVFYSLVPWSGKRSTEVIANMFAETMGVLSSNLARLILEAETNLGNLNTLEERLSTLHDMVIREDIATNEATDELLSDLWTMLGGNRKELKRYKEHLTLLKQVGTYRRKALIQVTGALETLRGMSDEMEDLRERVATPELVGARVPMEVHMESIQNGIKRLQEGRDKTKRLE
ncbi:hypothetical protein APHAL10511_007432 [Amanita phalloides]|nr:hypothetical protein APHAL10511_007432 [Amanita phalloides]